MKRITAICLLIALLVLPGCAPVSQEGQILATTLPVYEFTQAICQDTPLTVTRLINENVSCLHDYTLQANQAKSLENAQLVVISGMGLEGFLHDALPADKDVISASGIHDTEPSQDDSHHHHSTDPHIWLSAHHAMEMSQNICQGLCEKYPQHQEKFQENLAALLQRMEELESYGQEALGPLKGAKLITFHDGFGHLAESYEMTVLKAIEEESGSEASAKELIEIIALVETENVKAIFTECNGSVSAAKILSAETGVPVYALDMAMSGDSWFDAMYYNIDTLKEALG